MGVISLNHARVKARADRILDVVLRKRKANSLIDQVLMEYPPESQDGARLLKLVQYLCSKNPSPIKTMAYLKRIDWDKYSNQGKLWLCLFNNYMKLNSGIMTRALNTKFRMPFSFLAAHLLADWLRILTVFSVKQSAKRYLMPLKKMDTALRINAADRFSTSCDVLMEYAKTHEQAMKNYLAIIGLLQKLSAQTPREGNSTYTSIKLSSLTAKHNLNELTTTELDALSEKVLDILRLARKYNVRLIIDAEKLSSLDGLLYIFIKTFAHPELKAWSGYGLAVQAYHPRTLSILRDLHMIAAEQHKKIIVRLVKGAYWQNESKEYDDHDQYVYDDKYLTEASYLSAAEFLLQNQQQFIPCFATHNPFGIAQLMELSRMVGNSDFELHFLRGLGCSLHPYILGIEPNRIVKYSPVGDPVAAIGYLSRRAIDLTALNKMYANLSNARKELEEHEIKDTQLCSASALTNINDNMVGESIRCA